MGFHGLSGMGLEDQRGHVAAVAGSEGLAKGELKWFWRVLRVQDLGFRV